MNPDQIIDRVLTGLATTEAPPEMEHRLLSALQSRATASRRASSASTLPLFPPFKGRHPDPERSDGEGSRGSLRHPYFSNLSATSFRPWAIAAALIILSLTASLSTRKRHEPAHADAALKPHTAPPTTPASQLAEAPLERSQRHIVITASQPKPEAAPEDTNDLDAMAIIEMNAPSHPAPPLPLTHQEKLLDEAVHQDGPKDLSNLRPEVRAKEMELAKTEFQDFFDPPPTKDNE